MAKFRYKALDEAARPVAGELQAADVAEARQLLARQGLAAQQIAEISLEKKLSRADTLEFGSQLYDVIATKMPLAGGLHAVADELQQNYRSGRLVAAFRQLADRIESGMSLDNALAASKQLPDSLRGIIAAGARCGRLDETLSFFVELRRRQRDHARLLAAALGYPLLLLAFLAFLWALLVLLVLPEFVKLYDNFGMDLFGMELPVITKAVLGLGDSGIWILAYLILLPLVILLFVRLVWGRVAARRTIHAIPLVGDLIFCSAMSDSSRLLGLLLRQQVALPEALRLAADASRDSSLASNWRQLAERVTSGEALADSLTGHSDRLAYLSPVIRWSESNDKLDGAFSYLATVYEGRAEFLAYYLRTVVPPFIFIVILFGAMVIPMSLFLPLIELVQTLA